MKKMFVLLMLVCVAMIPAASLAETEVATITWEEFGEPMVAELGTEGEFIALSDLGLAVWLPSSMQSTAPSEEDAAAGRLAMFVDDDGSCALTVDVVNVEGMTLNQAYENAVNSQMVEPEIVNVNGLDILTYGNTAINTGCAVLVDTNGNIVIFSFTPVDSDAGKLAFSIICASIMPM